MTFACKDLEGDWIADQSARRASSREGMTREQENRNRLRAAIAVIEAGDETWTTVGDLIDAAKAVLDG